MKKVLMAMACSMTLLFILLAAQNSFSASMWYDYNIYAFGGEREEESIRIEMNFLDYMDREDILPEHLSYSVFASSTANVVGSYQDNFAVGKAQINLLEGSVGTYALASTGNHVVGGTVTSNSAYAEITAGFEDMLTFVIAPGIYDAPIYATLTGYIEGSITEKHRDTGADASMDPTHYQLWDFWAGDNRYSNGAYPYDEFGSFYNDFSFTLELGVAKKYLEEQIVQIPISASLKSVASVPSHRVENAWSKTDFSSTGSFTSLVVSDGVTWSSESSVFLADDIGTAAPIPEPSTWLLLAIGFSGLIWRTRCRQ
nr:PEP-CTERM sorting domain-containing protein [uncultured Desulfuromonas sp.]